MSLKWFTAVVVCPSFSALLPRVPLGFCSRAHTPLKRYKNPKRKERSLFETKQASKLQKKRIEREKARKEVKNRERCEKRKKKKGPKREKGEKEKAQEIFFALLTGLEPKDENHPFELFFWLLVPRKGPVQVGSWGDGDGGGDGSWRASK